MTFSLPLDPRLLMSLKKPTIYDIATEVGISPSTVAAVLNGTWKQRRIGAKTATKIQTIATKRGYAINLQARGLRHSRSGLIGMIVPMLDNRFFSSLAQAFEETARAKGLCPVVVSTLRDPKNEQSTVKTLISHNLEALFLAGATDPDALSVLCAAAGVPHINIDLPGTQALSVVSDNLGGALDITKLMIEEIMRREHTPDFCFIGGIETDHNTRCRIEGFCTGLRDAGLSVAPELMRANGYDARIAEVAIEEIYSRLGRLPHGLFVNSTISFEGVVRFLRKLPLESVRASTIGCFDWDPYIELLHFPVIMARQNVRGLIEHSYDLIDVANEHAGTVLVPIEIVRPSKH
jgi:LacI family fructose operon transcriptional repressor